MKSIRNSSLQKVVGALKRHSSFLVTAHRNPEGDALGAELALAHLLRRLGKRAVVVNEDPVPAEYRFIPERARIRPCDHRIRPQSFDAFVIVDCSDLQRSGAVARLSAGKPVIDIDHHITNEGFGDVCWVDPSCSSSCEQVYLLYRQLKVSFDAAAAMQLYIGIATDTGYFRYSNTTPRTHEAAAELMRAGRIVPSTVYRAVYEDIPFSQMLLVSRLVGSAESFAGGKILAVKVPRSLVGDDRQSVDLGEHILSALRAVKGVEAVLLAKENPGPAREVRINLRAQGRVDVSAVARRFGGGGHRSASGATVRGSLAAVSAAVIRVLKALV